MLTIKTKIEATDLVKVFDKNRNPFLISFTDFKKALKPAKKPEEK